LVGAQGIGAALVLPAMVALVASNFCGQDRALAYGVLGGVSGAGIAVGPILGGWGTTELGWRVVFAGEVLLALGILIGARLIREPERHGPRERVDVVGGILSASGLGVAVLGVLQASNWGWLLPRNSPIEPFGLALTPFVIALGGRILVAFGRWERRRERRGEAPLVHLDLISIPRLRGALAMLIAQNLVLMGIFFTVPLFLQIVQGLDALETGVRMLPASVGLFLSALAGSALAKRFPARTLVRAGLIVVFVAVLLLLDTVEPQLDNASFMIAMGVLGIGMGLVVSQLGNVVQSSVEDRDRSEAGGLQNTSQQLGSSLGTAVLGAILITGLLTAFSANVARSPEVSAEVRQAVEVRASAGATFAAADEVTASARRAGLDQVTTDALVEDYEEAQLDALKVAFLAAAVLALVSLSFTRHLPTRRFEELQAETGPPPAPV
jgi:MFS family permease